MSIRKRIVKRFYRQANIHGPSSGVHHSQAYHQHFEDWSEREVLGHDGRVHIERIYVGNYYQMDCNDRARIKQRILYATLYLIIAAFFVLASVQNVGSNRSVYVVATQFLSLLSLIWTLTALFNYLTVPRKMTISEWKTSSARLKHASLCTALCLTITLLMMILYLLLSKTYSTIELICALTYFAAALASLLLNRLESKARYIQEKNPQSIAADAFMVE